MWSAISKIFTKNNGDHSAQSGDQASADPDRGLNERSDVMDSQDSYDTRQAKQRASVKWILSKAFNNKVPENLREPFYRDHENQEHLKPQIVGALANAEMYCLALGNIYSDPNYHNLNHWSILQTLARKGVYVTDPNDSQITETTLIQTNPLRMNAHMAVIESTMTLYAKEVVTPDRVMAAVQRFYHGRSAPPAVPESYEQGLLLWISHACEALRKRIQQDLQTNGSNGRGEGDQLKPPSFPEVKDLKSLCDGVSLAALISYYCPDELPWTSLRISYLPTVSESLHNLSLVQKFCQECLPSSVFHMMPEDVTYMRGSMKNNLIVFLADLFNVLEINPIKCVRYPETDKTLGESFPTRNSHGVVHKRNLPQSVMTPIPDLRSSLEDSSTPAFQVSRSAPAHMPLRKTNSFQSTAEMSEDSLRRGSDDSFVVHRGKNIPTLSSVISGDPLLPARLRGTKEKQNHDSKAEERGDSRQVPAGRPSNWEETKKPSFAGRRSRRNSVSDDSQLTIENFGGSQDNINFIGRNPDKEVAVHVGRKISAPAGPSYESYDNPAIRSSKEDARGSFKLGYDNGCDEEKQDNERETFKLKRQLSNDEISLRNLMKNKENISADEPDKRMSFAELSKQRQFHDQGGIQLVYMQNEKEESAPVKSSFLGATTNGSAPERKTTTFATLPNTTTWQQQCSANSPSQGADADDANGGQLMNSQLGDIRMKLEEKRRHIEGEKRRIEVAMNKQRQKVGKAAFLQAVVKGKGNLLKTPTDSEASSNTGSAEPSPSNEQSSSNKPQRPLTLQEITDDASSVERKWLDDSQPFIETRRTPDLENMDVEQYQHSIAQMNSSLHDIQADIQRLATQQNQLHQHQLAHQQKQHLHSFQQSQHYQPIQPSPPYATQQSYNSPQDYRPPSQGSMYNPIQSSASAPHIPQSLYQQTLNSHRMEQPQFFLHDSSNQPPAVPQRRTWAQQAQQQQQQQQANDSYHHQQQQQQPEMRTWNHPASNPFILHESSERYDNPRYQDTPKYQNGVEHNHASFTLSQQYAQQQLFGSAHATPSASPQHKSVHRQISQLMDEGKPRTPVSLQQMDASREGRKSNITHAPIPAPSADDMEPQSISFIGNAEENQISEGISRLNITSGSRTYRIPSPTRPLISRSAFQPSPPPPVAEKDPAPSSEISSLDNDPTSQKGFYISFDNEQPKRPKPPLRMKRGSPKKETSADHDFEYAHNQDVKEKEERMRQLEKELELERLKREVADRRKEEATMRERQRREPSQEKDKVTAASAIIIGNDLSNPDPDLIDEREKKKERIMLLSLQRRQQQEEAKQKKEQEAHARREREKAKEEEKIRKKEEQVHRRAAILEQYKLKKAIDEAEREGKHLDPSMLNTMKPMPKMRSKGSTPRPRPKTIHIDSGSVEMAEGMMPSKGKRGSNTNLTANSYSSSMRRDYYRGSQDSLADRGLGSTSMLYKDSPDDSRGMSPCHSANQTLGRRSSYKTSRDPSPAQVRGRPKLSTYQNFKGRKSNSMMNLYGSSTDQDSLAYRYGDTDSGLGRATPPRRAPSPGMGPMRHLPSPSGPGSLPGLMPKRRMFDDGSSDISSTPSSMMDYTGPRLYKQPATKSNRGIILNAVEYCVFPGVVNREAKKRVLEEIARSESKHFLILFRDAGCQFRALYSYCPDRDEVLKLYGTGPRQVNDRMFDKFFKYNSGGKCFSQVHTKHLTVTIDAFTIHNSLWQGKKVNLPNKKDMPLVI